MIELDREILEAARQRADVQSEIERLEPRVRDLSLASFYALFLVVNDEVKRRADELREGGT